LCVAVACGLSAFVGYAMLTWKTPPLIRVKGMTLKEVAACYSVILGVTGAFGAGWLADKLSHRDRRW
jgi:sugar phosphate permease